MKTKEILSSIGTSLTMGEKLKALVETQLKKDLQSYGVYETELTFDWSQAYGTGRSAKFLDGTMQNFNRVIVFDHKNNLLADGCVDFIATRFFLLAYWDLVTTWSRGEVLREKSAQGMPFKIWRQLPEALMVKHSPQPL